MGLIERFRRRRRRRKRERYKASSLECDPSQGGCAGVVNAIYGTQQAMYNRTGGFVTSPGACHWTTWKGSGDMKLKPDDCKCPDGDLMIPVAVSNTDADSGHPFTVVQCFPQSFNAFRATRPTA